MCMGSLKMVDLFLIFGILNYLLYDEIEKNDSKL